MKVFLIFTAISYTAMTTASEILTLEKSSTFFPPQSIQIVVHSSGRVTKTYHNESSTETKHLALLSHDAIERLEMKIKTISADAKLVDPNPEIPECMDAPSTIISAKINHDFTILRTKLNCHVASVQMGKALELITFMEGLEQL